MRFISLILFLLLAVPAWADDSQPVNVAVQIRGEISVQLKFLRQSSNLGGQRGTEERSLRAQNIAQLFFDQKLKSYQEREIVFDIARDIVSEMEVFFTKSSHSPEVLETLAALELAFSENYRKLVQSGDYQDSRTLMKQRAAFAGFALVPGAIFAAFIAGDLLLLVGNSIHTGIYTLPAELWIRGKHLVKWTALQWAKLRRQADRIGSCKQQIKDLRETERARVRHALRSFQRFFQQWGRRLRPRYLLTYLGVGTGLSIGFYYLPIPYLSDLGFEDQHDWDAQEDALHDILLPFFNQY